jgi:hypothetical protein
MWLDKRVSYLDLEYISGVRFQMIETLFAPDTWCETTWKDEGRLTKDELWMSLCSVFSMCKIDRIPSTQLAFCRF